MQTRQHGTTARRSRTADAELEEARYGKAYDARVVRRLWRFVLPYRGRLLLAVVCMLAGACSHLAAPYLIKLAVDGAITTGDADALTLITMLFAGNAVLGWGVQYAESLLMARVAQRVLFDIRQTLFQHLVRLDLAFYDRQAVGRLMSRMQNDVGALQDLFTTGLLSTIGDLLLLGGILGVMLSMHLQLTLITCSVVPLVVFMTIYWRARSRVAFHRVRSTLARVNALLQENISGVRVIQSLVAEADNLRRFSRDNAAHLDTNLAAARLAARLLPSIEMVSMGAIVLVLVFGGPLVIAGSLSAGGLVSFILYMLRFFEPIRDISFRWNYLQMAMASGERILEVLDAPAQIGEPQRPVVLPRLRGDVEFRHVWFHYHPGSPVLRDVSLRVPAGQRLAIVGPTGAGKTTLINLVARLYDVTGGALYIDGVDIRQLSLAQLRRQIGLVLQEPFLFSGTVRDNLRYGNPEVGEAEMMAAARAIGVHDHLMRLPQAYDTDVSERGGLLSYGQRQLISLVRALLVDPRILILDEATASVDIETERLMQAGLERLWQGRTTFIIAHRLSTVRHADRIVVLDQGRVVEDGSHETLLRHEGLYARLAAMTYSGMEDKT